MHFFAFFQIFFPRFRTRNFFCKQITQKFVFTSTSRFFHAPQNFAKKSISYGLWQYGSCEVKYPLCISPRENPPCRRNPVLAPYIIWETPFFAIRNLWLESKVETFRKINSHFDWKWPKIFMFLAKKPPFLAYHFALKSIPFYFFLP